MGKTKYAIQTIIGEVTRTGNGHYSHLVVAKGLTVAHIEKWAAREVKEWSERLAEDLADKKSGFQNSYDKEYKRMLGFGRTEAEARKAAEENRELYREYSEESIAQAREMIAKNSGAGLAEQLKKRMEHTTFAFAGREDLADKTARKFSDEGWQEIEIIEITDAHRREVKSRKK